MRTLAVVLVHLACVGQGYRLQNTAERSPEEPENHHRAANTHSSSQGLFESQDDSQPSVVLARSQSHRRDGVPQMKAISTLCLAFNSAIGRQLAGPHQGFASRNCIGECARSVRLRPDGARSSSGNVVSSAVVDLQQPKTNKVSRFLAGFGFSTIATTVVLGVYPLAISAWLLGTVFDNHRRRASDAVVQLWARLTMSIFGAGVQVEGIENLPPSGEPVMYCPNHCSFLDIFALSGYLPRRFKYISKIEILRIPLIGWAMRFAKHIALRRTDRASQIKTLKEAVESLKVGNSLVTFPEGTRSKDGRLGDFKKGAFTMASRAGVRVVPVTIVGTHLFQPPGALVPFAIPRGIRIVIHPALDVPVAKKEGETLQAAKAAVESALPQSMKPVLN